MAEKPTYQELEQRIKELETENSEYRRLKDGFEMRIMALTRPLKDDGNIHFEDLFDIDDIQCLQDEFARATGVASIITRTDGTPITAPSNFCRLCKDIIRKTDRGLANCYRSDAMIGRFHPEGPIIQPCMSGGLWDAGAGITVGGRHVANWLIGQIRDERQTGDDMIAYARKIGASETDVINAFHEVPAMSRGQFGQIARFLFMIANQLSTTAYQNVQQARFIAERDQTEQVIRESEERFRYLSDGSMEAIFFTKNGFCLEANQVAAEMFGFEDRSQFIGLFGTDIVAPEYHRIVKSHMLTDSFEPYEVVGLRKDGTRFPISIRAKAMPYKNEGMIRVTSITDIIERKQAEERILETEKRFRVIFEKSPYPMALTEIKTGRLIEVNDMLCEKAGLQKEELLGKTTTELEFYSPESRDMFIGLLLKNGKVDGLEMKFQTQNQVYLTKMFADFIAINNTQYVITTFEDITAQKQAEIALRESEARFKALHNASFGGIAIHDKGMILECNQGMSEMTGYPLPELMGMDGLLLISETSRPMVMNHILSGYEEPYEAIGLRKNGEEFPVRLEARNVPYKGKMVRTVEFRDITAQKQAERERKKLQDQLNQAQKMESVGRLAGGVAHDFNNMLGVILGHTEMALEEVSDNQPLHADLKEIQKAAQRSADLTKQLLTFARKQIISPKVLNLNETVEEMLSMLRRLIGEDIMLIWKPAGNLWQVKMDPSQIDQILANLCVNARDAITGVGKLTLETKNMIFDQAFCEGHAGFFPGSYILLAVSDTGCGMDKHTMDNLFEPFFTTKEIGKGTGLGLATLYGIVKQNNGFITVYSEPGVGTTFNIYLPRHTCIDDGTKIRPSGEPAPGGTETILLVEDEPAILTMTRMMLERKGYTVLTACTPGEAMSVAKGHEGDIHLLMTDIIMPEMNGRDLSTKLMILYPNIKLLFMSGYTANIIAEQGVLDEGVNFIQKPFASADLAVRLRAVLDETGSGQTDILSLQGHAGVTG